MQPTDFCNFFRALCDFECSRPKTETPEDHREHLTLPSNLQKFVSGNSRLETWLKRYNQRLLQEGSDNIQRSKAMKKNNPKFILRNYLAQNAITAAEQGDFSEFNTLSMLLSSPFDEHPDYQQYAAEPPEWGQKLEISCSS